MMESQFDIEALMIGFFEGSYLEDNPPALQELSIAAYKLLLNGKPITPRDIAAATGRESTEICKLFELIPASAYECNDCTEITGFIGLSITPTNHEFIVEGQTFYTWCVLDGLFLPEVIGKNATIGTKCPATGVDIKIELSPDRVLGATPEDLVMSVIKPDRDDCCDNLRGAFCNHVNFFANKAAYMEWANDRPNYKCVTLEQAYNLARQRNRARYPDLDLGNTVVAQQSAGRDNLNG